MNPEWMTGIAALAALLGGLAAWGAKGQVETLRAEMGTLRAEIGTLRAEMGEAIAKAGLEFYRQVNGTYARTKSLNDLTARVDGIENRVNDLGD
jgi:cell division protein FtsB